MTRGNLSHWETDGLFECDDDATPVMDYFVTNHHDDEWTSDEIKILEDFIDCGHRVVYNSKQYIAGKSCKDIANKCLDYKFNTSIGCEIAKEISVCGYVNPYELSYMLGYQDRNMGLSYIHIEKANLIPGCLNNGVYPANIYSDILGLHRFGCSNMGSHLVSILEAAFYAIEHNSTNHGVGIAIVKALKLYYIIGMDYTDISITLGVSTKSAQWLVETGIKFLQQSLLKY